MKRLILFSIVVCALSVSACAMPKTPEEYRKLIQDHPNSPGMRAEHFEVQRPFPDTARFVKKMSYACLNSSMKRTSRTSNGGIPSNTSVITRYDPVVNIGADRAEIYVTETYLKANGEETGQDKIFTFLLDLASGGKTKTKADLYYTWGEPRPRVAKAVREWANGKNAACPDLAP